MKLLPYKSFTLTSNDPPAVVCKRLAQQIEAPKAVRWFWNRNHKPYSGYILDNSFKITRIIHYRNSFLPVIRGKLESVGSETHIHIKMNLHPLVLGFMGVWCSIWFGFITLFFTMGEIPLELGIIFIGVPLLAVIAFWCAFWYEVNKSSRDLINFIQGYSPRSQTEHNQSLFSQKQSKWILAGIGLSIFLISGNLIFSNQLKFPSLGNEKPTQPRISCSKTPDSELCEFTFAYTITGHPKASVFSISSDHQILVSGGEDKALKVWDLDTGALKQTFQSDSGVIQSIAISPDGKFVVSGSGDQMVRVWNLETGERQAILKGHGGAVNFVTVNPNGKEILSGSIDGVFKSWDMPSILFKEKLATSSDQGAQPIPSHVKDKATLFIPKALSDNGKIVLALDSWRNVIVWNLETGNKIQTLKSGFTSTLLSTYVSPDGKFAVIEYGNNFKKYQTFFKIWDLRTGRVIAKNIINDSSQPHQQTFGAMPITLNNDYIIGAKNKKLQFWSLKTGRLEASTNASAIRLVNTDSQGKIIAGLTGDPHYQNSKIDVWQQP